MTDQKIKDKVLAYGDWEWWAERPFGAFVMSLFKDGNTRPYFHKTGVDAEWPATLYQKGAFYKSNIVWDAFSKQLENYLSSGGSVQQVVLSCEQYGLNAKEEVAKLLQSNKEPLEKFASLYEILTLNISYVWLAHGFDHIFQKRLYDECSRHVPKDQLDKFIGDISYPQKKNAHHFLEDALRSNAPLEKIQTEFGWIKSRDGFSDGFTLDELRSERAHVQETVMREFARPAVPAELAELVSIAQELVYYRTLRTDIFYGLLWQARPITAAVGELYGIPFKELIDYSVLDLIAGKPKKYPRLVTYISYGSDSALLEEPILNDSYAAQIELRGLVANIGVARGVAKIVRTAQEIDKVEAGDILFAPTTAPSYIIGMKKAAAFVTDEGGITSHAAIVSREMDKPCIIGTKIGTKMFNDGDIVQVDATKGVVRKI